MARKFFFVCAGMLCLALAYNLGTRPAHGDGGASVDGEHIDCDRGPNGTILVTGVVGRTYYWNGQPVAPPIPGTARAVATCGGSGFYMVVLENGDIYHGTDSQWTYIDNLAAKPTPVNQETWGGLKSRYR